MLRLAKLDDPRLATLYLTWLAQGNWPAPTAKVVWTRIFEHLGTLRDTRAIEPLRAVVAALPAFVGAEHRVWITSSIEAVVKQLAAVKPAKVTVALPATPAAPKPAPDRKRAVAAVWADPTDDALKQVVADALLEHDDPWGEFIAIQLRGAQTTPQQRTRAKALERTHGAEWLGAIGRLTLESAWRFENGFPVAVENNRRAVPRRDFEAALRAPQWATIDRLCISILVTPIWWITAWVKSPASRNVRAFELARIQDKRAAMRIERDHGTPWRLVRVGRGMHSASLPIWRAFVAGLTAAERALVVVGTADVADRESYVAVLAV
ncbi:MAG: hypothetical protein ABI867_12935 [Kofleriaceae bacterium]